MRRAFAAADAARRSDRPPRLAPFSRPAACWMLPSDRATFFAVAETPSTSLTIRLEVSCAMYFPLCLWSDFQPDPDVCVVVGRTFDGPTGVIWKPLAPRCQGAGE